MKSKFNLFLIIAILISLGVLAVALGYYFAYQKKPTENKSEPEKISTLGWKEYRNSQYGFLLEYPNDWEVGDNRSEIKIYLPPDTEDEEILQQSGKINEGIIISVRENSKSLSSRDWIEENISISDYQKRNLSDVIYNSISGTKIDKYQDTLFAVYLAREKSIYEISAYVKDKLAKIEAMLSTFKFSEIEVQKDKIYVVKEGETLSFIASKFNIAWPKLAKYNKIKSADQVFAGQEIKIPSDPNSIPSSGPGFSLDYELAKKYQDLVDTGKQVWRLDTLEVAKREIPSQKGIAENDNFRIITEDRLSGKVTIEITTKDGKIYIANLVQPVRSGSGGIWMVESLKIK